MEERSTFSRAVVKAARRGVASKDHMEQFAAGVVLEILRILQVQI